MLCQQRVMRLTGVIAAGLLLVGCSEGETTSNISCTADDSCPQGQYCGAAGLCRADCSKDTDCPGGGRCSDRGQCYGGTIDGGAIDSGAADGGGSMADAGLAADLEGAGERPVGLEPSGLVDLGPAADRLVVVIPDHGQLQDLGPLDLPATDTASPTCSAAVLGRACTEANAASVCGAAHFCYAPFIDSDVGFCTCLCTPDDEDTSGNEDSCPGQPGNRCHSLSAQAAVCFQTCAPRLGGNDCQGQLACHPQAGGLFGIYDATVCAVEGCSSDADCPVFTDTPCGAFGPTCPTGQTCYSIAGGNDGVCARPGSCDLPSGLCGPHGLGTATALVGDPCVDDTDCAGNMFCVTEYDQARYEKAGGVSCSESWECCSGECANGSCTAGLCLVQNRNGYCSISGCQFADTLSSAACGSGAACSELYSGGVCLKSCSLTGASSCRGHSGDLWGDYECRAWNNFGITPGPVCDFGFTFTCAQWASATGGMLDCSDFGDATNSTQMTCRTLDGQITSGASASGFCFDTTSSGSLHR